MTEIEQQLQDEIIGLQIQQVEQEKQIRDLSSVLLRIQKEMLALQRELKQLKDKLATPSEADRFNLEEEKPPHY